MTWAQGARWIAVMMLAGCTAEVGDTTAGLHGGPESVPHDEAEISLAILDLANAGDRTELLTAGLDTRQADAVIAARPIASIAALGAVPYIGDSALRKLLVSEAPEATEAGAGFWSEVLLDPAQVQTVLEMANTAELTTLGCDMGFSSSMGQRVIDSRSYASVDQLMTVSYFGKSQLERLKNNIAWWLSIDGAAGRFDCIAFSAAQEAAALRVANEAGYGQLGGSLYGRVAPGRPYASLANVASTYGIGPATMSALRSYGDWVIAGSFTPSLDTIASLGGNDLYMIGDVQVVDPEYHSGIYRDVIDGYGYTRMEVPCVLVADANDPNPEANAVPFCHGIIRGQYYVEFGFVRVQDLEGWRTSVTTDLGQLGKVRWMPVAWGDSQELYLFWDVRFTT